MHFRSRILVAVTVLVPALSACAHAAEPADSLSLSDAVQITCVDGVLKFRWADDQVQKLSPVETQGPEAKWRISAIRASENTMQLDRVRTATTRPEHFWDLLILSSPDMVSIHAMRAGSSPQQTQLRFYQRTAGGIQMQVIRLKASQTLNLRADNLLELRLRNPRVVKEIIEPMLEQLGVPDLLTPGAADVYRVFDEIAADEKTIAAVHSILPKLSSPSFVARESASSELRRLGGRAVLVLLRMDRSELTPEAQERIERLFLQQSRRTFNDPQAMRSDVPFLADCVDFADERVRTAALARIEQLTGWRVPPADWAHPADYLRGKIAQRDKTNGR